MRCPEGQMHEPGASGVASLLKKLRTFLRNPTGVVIRFLEMKRPREPAIGTETMKVGINIATGCIVEPIDVIVFTKDG